MKTDLHATFQALAAEKQAVLKREEKLVADLREVLAKLGYRLEPISANGTSRPAPVSGRRRRSAPRGSKPLACAECGRTFALPLHLGRHMSVMHKGKRALSSPQGSSASENGSAKTASKTKSRRRRMSPAARRAAARRMKAYWKKRKAAERAKPSSSSRRTAARAKTGRSQQRAA
jgi:hypothetical protein